jgi:hypothetical protein
VDSWHIGTDPDICTTDSLLITFEGTGTWTPDLKIKVIKKKSQNSRTQGLLLLFLLDDGRIRICTNNDGSGKSKNLQLRIKNTENKSVLDPDSIRSSDPDPGGQKWPTKT